MTIPDHRAVRTVVLETQQGHRFSIITHILRPGEGAIDEDRVLTTIAMLEAMRLKQRVENYYKLLRHELAGDAIPAQPGYTYGGDAFRGPSDAEIGLVAFIDFQSAENRTRLLEVWPDVEETYVEPGKVMLIIKHFPAPDQDSAFKAAEAAECAGQQEAFWAMHDLLFDKQEEWGQAEDVVVTLKEYAAELVWIPMASPPAWTKARRRRR